MQLMLLMLETVPGPTRGALMNEMQRHGLVPAAVRSLKLVESELDQGVTGPGTIAIILALLARYDTQPGSPETLANLAACQFKFDKYVDNLASPHPATEAFAFVMTSIFAWDAALRPRVIKAGLIRRALAHTTGSILAPPPADGFPQGLNPNYSYDAPAHYALLALHWLLNICSPAECARAAASALPAADSDDDGLSPARGAAEEALTSALLKLAGSADVSLPPSFRTLALQARGTPLAHELDGFAPT